jgi:hypothetical protein
MSRFGYVGSLRARPAPAAADVATTSGLTDPDYTWACRVDASDAERRRAEGWARAVFGSAPKPLWWFVLAGWLGILRLRLASQRSPDHVYGWTIQSSEPDTAVLATDSFMLTARLVVRRDDGGVSHTTLVRYDAGIARVVWPVAALIHQRVIPYLLTRAASAP